MKTCYKGIAETLNYSILVSHGIPLVLTSMVNFCKGKEGLMATFGEAEKLMYGL